MSDPEILRCGRMTAKDRACRTRIGPPDIACALHSSAEELAASARLRLALNTSWQDGYACGFQAAEQRQRFAADESAREARDAASFRTVTEDGAQIVRCGRYTYAWRGAPALAVGDRVLLPGSWVDPKPRVAIVTELGSSYVGTLATIIRRAEGSE